MRITYFLLLVALTHFINETFAQTFEKYYKTELDDIVLDAIQVDSSSVVFALCSGEYYADFYQTRLFKMNFYTGEFIDSTEIAIDYNNYSGDYLTHFSRLSDSTFILLFGTKHLIDSDHQLYIGVFKNSLKQVFDTIIGDIYQDDHFFDFIIDDNRIVSVGYRNQSGNLLVYVTDLSGNHLADVEYMNGVSLLSTVIDVPGTNSYHIYRYWDTDHSFLVINKYNLQTDSIIQYPSGYLPRNTLPGLESNYYFVAGRQLTTYPDTLSDFLSFLKVSQNGQVIQQFNYQLDDKVTYYTYNSFSTSATKIYMSGAYPVTWVQVPPIFFYPEQRYILLDKIDNDGNLIWQNFYKGDVNYMAYKVMATPDGGALIFGTRYDWNDPIPDQRDLYILKIDSLGYYTPLTGLEDQNYENQRQILVYPNPVQDKLNFVFGLYHDLTISIFDMQGNRMRSETFAHSAEMDLTGLSRGVYFYRITGAKGFAEKGKIIKN